MSSTKKSMMIYIFVGVIIVFTFVSIINNLDTYSNSNNFSLFTPRKPHEFKVTSKSKYGSHSSQRKLDIEYWSALHENVNSTFLNKILKDNQNYGTKEPFPHMFTDNVFPMSVLFAATEEIVDNPNRTPKGCAVGSTNCYSEGTQKYKSAFNNEMDFGPATAALFAFLKSSTFITFLEFLTKIENLIPDPHYKGSGIHQTMPGKTLDDEQVVSEFVKQLSGGKLDVHADFNRYARYDMHRRVNVFVYLNPNWTDSYGGHLELWSKDLKSCKQHILPTLGRLVVFSSTDFSYHGHSKPLSCPPNRSRRSLAMYYYTRTRPNSECVNHDCNSTHSTLFQKTACATCEEISCQKYPNYHL